MVESVFQRYDSATNALSPPSQHSGTHTFCPTSSQEMVSVATEHPILSESKNINGSVASSSNV